MVLSNVIVDVIQLTLTLKMTTAQVVETSVTVNNNSPIQDYVHLDDQTQPFDKTEGVGQNYSFNSFRVVDLHNRKAEERQSQTLCNKRVMITYI